MRKCDNCHWGREIQEVEGVFLQCRKRAPLLVVMQQRDGLTRLTEWPRVSPDHDCGDHFYKVVVDDD